ncbi:MAG TPA: hypothetical protein PKM50_09565 [Methanoregula sp.]|nr:hypothetical protein [Methanoregula sp.]
MASIILSIYREAKALNNRSAVVPWQTLTIFFCRITRRIVVTVMIVSGSNTNSKDGKQQAAYNNTSPVTGYPIWAAPEYPAASETSASYSRITHYGRQVKNKIPGLAGKQQIGILPYYISGICDPLHR